MPSPALSAALLAAFAAFGLALSPAWDFDLWFHLACGRTMVELGRIPLHDTLSFTAGDGPWDTHEWLSQLVLYLAARAGGLPGLAALKAAFSAAVFLVLVRHAVRRGADPWLSALVAGCAAFTMRWFLVERPGLFSMLFLALQLSILQSGRGLPWLVPLSLAWANLHGGSALLGPAVTGMWCAGTALSVWRRGGSLATLGKPALVMLGQLAALLANPAGPALLAYPFSTVSDRNYMEMVREWLPPTPHEMPGFFAFLGASALVLVLTVRNWAPADLVPVLAFAVLSLSARRHIPLLCIAIVPPAAKALTMLAGNRLSPSVVRATAVTALLLPVAVLAVRGDALRTGVRSDFYPSGACQALEGTAAQGEYRVFTMHKWGGYLEWNLPPRFKTFIDGRQMVFGPGLFADYYRLVGDSPEASGLMKLWSPDAYIIEYGTPLGKRFALTREAALVRWDDSSLTFLARTPRNAAAIARGEYRAFNPETGVRGSLTGAVAEAHRAAREAPGDGRPLAILSSLLLSAGDKAGARRAAEEAVKRTPNTAPSLLALADSLVAEEDFTAARSAIARARRADRTSTGPRLALAKLALAEGNPARALVLASEAVKAGERRMKYRGQPEPVLLDAYLTASALLRAGGDAKGASEMMRLAGNCANELSEPERAIELYGRALELTPEDFRLPHNTGSVLLQLGRNAAAAESFRKALGLSPRSVDTLVSLGVAYQRLNLTPLARECWKKALEIDPNNGEARRQLENAAP